MLRPRPLFLWTALCWSLAAAAGFAKEAGVVVGGATLSLDQLNKEVLIARDRHAAAGAAERDEPRRALELLVTQRATLLAATIAADPAMFLQLALPSGTADTMPADLRKEVERSVTIEGVMEPARGAPAFAGFPYDLRDRQGRRLRLAVAGAAPAVAPGAAVEIRGWQLRGVLVFRGADLRSVSRSGLDAEPPRVAIEIPQHGAVLRGRITVRVAASDNQRVQHVQLRKGGAPAGTDFDPPFEFAWDTAADADGPHTLAAHAHDADMNLGSSAPITVTVDNTAPRIQLISPEPGTPLAGLVPLEAEAGDAIGIEAVKFLVDGMAVGISVTPPYRITWDSSAAANGPHSIEALALDRAQNSAKTEQVPVRILNANHPPKLIPTGAKAVQEGVTLSFIVKALDKDGTKDPLIYRLTNAPPWAHFNASTGQLYGTPGFAEASAATPTRVYDKIVIEACDAQPLCDREEIAISVINVNRPPVMEPLRVPSVLEGTPLTITPLVTDPDGEPLACAAYGLPSWLTFDAASCSVSGTPAADLVGRQDGRRSYADLRFEACDANNACVQQSMTLTVVNDNRRPALVRIGDRAVDELKTLKIDIQAGDLDQDMVTVTAAPLPEGAVLAERAGGATFTWTPRADQAGSYAMTIQASDGSLRDAETIQIRVRETHLSISGVIRTDIGARLAGAAVEISRGNARATLVRTNDKGEYLATDLPPGSYELRPNAKLSNLPSFQVIHFGPLSRRVELTDRDQREMDFTSHFKTR